MAEMGPMLNSPEALALMKLDLQRVGELPDEALLYSYLNAAAADLARQGIGDDGSPDYEALVVGTASWMYRKRITGEAEPRYLRRMRLDRKFSGLGGGADA